MTIHLYLSMIPEALIASMLTPEEFGVYYAVGTQKKSRGQAIFFEIDPDFRHDFFPIEEGIRRCMPHEDGSPKRSIYISVYRVLEHVSLEVIQKLYLVTQDGRMLDLESSNIFKRVGKFIPLAVPLFIYAIRHTNMLAMALESRGFSPEAKRSLYLEPQMRTVDYAVLIVLALTWAGMLLLRFRGYGEVLPRL